MFLGLPEAHVISSYLIMIAAPPPIPLAVLTTAFCKAKIGVFRHYNRSTRKKAGKARAEAFDAEGVISTREAYNIRRALRAPLKNTQL